LAIQYIVKTGGSSGFQAFIRDMLAGQSAAQSVRDVLSQEWPDFEKNVHEFSVNSFKTYMEEDQTSAPAAGGKH
jgi:hypothetical protein